MLSAAVQRVKKVLGARPTAESTKSTEPSQTPAPAPASKKPSPAATFATPDGMRQECSKRKKMADSNLSEWNAVNCIDSKNFKILIQTKLWDQTKFMVWFLNLVHSHCVNLFPYYL